MDWSIDRLNSYDRRQLERVELKKVRPESRQKDQCPQILALRIPLVETTRSPLSMVSQYGSVLCWLVDWCRLIDWCLLVDWCLLINWCRLVDWCWLIDWCRLLRLYHKNLEIYQKKKRKPYQKKSEFFRFEKHIECYSSSTYVRISKCSYPFGCTTWTPSLKRKKNIGAVESWVRVGLPKSTNQYQK